MPFVKMKPNPPLSDPRLTKNFPVPLSLSQAMFWKNKQAIERRNTTSPGWFSFPNVPLKLRTRLDPVE